MFAEKVKYAEVCGAVGAIIIDNQPNTRYILFSKVRTSTFLSGEALGIFSMAGDGETTVEIGSAFLPTKEANLLLEAYSKDKSIEVAISAKVIDAETFKTLRSEVRLFEI